MNIDKVSIHDIAKVSTNGSVKISVVVWLKYLHIAGGCRRSVSEHTSDLCRKRMYCCLIGPPCAVPFVHFSPCTARIDVQMLKTLRKYMY